MPSAGTVVRVVLLMSRVVRVRITRPTASLSFLCTVMVAWLLLRFDSGEVLVRLVPCVQEVAKGCLWLNEKNP